MHFLLDILALSALSIQILPARNSAFLLDLEFLIYSISIKDRGFKK